jgi:hypothetical protein
LFSPWKTWSAGFDRSLEAESACARRGWLIDAPRLPLSKDVRDHEPCIDRTDVTDVVRLRVFCQSIAHVEDVLVALRVEPLDRALGDAAHEDPWMRVPAGVAAGNVRHILNKDASRAAGDQLGGPPIVTVPILVASVDAVG